MCHLGSGEGGAQGVERTALVPKEVSDVKEEKFFFSSIHLGVSGCGLVNEN